MPCSWCVCTFADVHTGVPVGMLGLANRRPTELQNWTGQQQNVYLLLRQDLLAEETETQRIEFEKLLIVLVSVPSCSSQLLVAFLPEMWRSSCPALPCSQPSPSLLSRSQPCERPLPLLSPPLLPSCRSARPPRQLGAFTLP